MKKICFTGGPVCFRTNDPGRRTTILKNGLPSETYITCAEANEMAKTDSAQVAEIVAVMGNASVASRDLKN